MRQNTTGTVTNMADGTAMLAPHSPGQAERSPYSGARKDPAPNVALKQGITVDVRRFCDEFTNHPVVRAGGAQHTSGIGECCQHCCLAVLNLCRDLPDAPQVEAAAFKGTFGNVSLLKYYFITENVRQESSFHTCGHVTVRL